MIQVLEFDGWLREQDVFGGESEKRCKDPTKVQKIQWIDFTALQGTNGYCDGEAAAVIMEKTAGRMRKSHPVTWIGNGNYHYAAHLLTMHIKEPFSLVVLDHHPDMQPSFFPELLSCGSWVLHALEHNPMLRQVILIGVKEELLQTLPDHPGILPVMVQGKRVEPQTGMWDSPSDLSAAAQESAAEKGVPINKNENLNKTNIHKHVQDQKSRLCKPMGASCLYQFLCHGKTVTAISESFFQDPQHQVSALGAWINQQAEGPVYLSVDKDVLCREDCITNWDSGSMALSELLVLLEWMVDNHTVIGMDFCGESSESGEPDGLANNRRCNARILQKLKEIDYV